MTKIDNAQLREYLLQHNMAPRDVVDAAYQHAQRENVQLCRVLTDRGVDPVVCAKATALSLGYPFIDLSKESIPTPVLGIIPEQVAKKSHVVAFAKEDDAIKVAMLDPENLQTLDFLRKKTGLAIIPYLTTAESLQTAIKQYTKSLKAEFGDMIPDGAVADAASEEDDLAKMAQDLPIVRIIDTLVKHAILEGASDVHIEPEEKEIIVRYRIDGVLRTAMTLPKSALSGIVARVKVLANLKLDEHRLPQDGRFKIENEDYKISFRVSILPVFDGEKIVMRLLNESAAGLTLEKMGMHGEALEIVHREIQKPNGMILVTGPTGSGKTTTLYTVVDLLNSPKVNISTVEDPVEYRMEHINQTQVNAKIGMTFAAALRALLRQDPDIVMVGEIRDKETLEIAIHAAMTGHLVLSTLHTNSAAGAIPRMVDMGAEAFLIASTVNIVIGQRLVRRLCSECRQAYRLDAQELATLGKNYDMEAIAATMRKLGVMTAESFGEVELYRPRGCAHCGDTGYKGRLGIFEVLEVTDDIEKRITHDATTEELERAARGNGMVTMVEDGFCKVLQGITSVEEVMRVTKE